MQTAAPTQSRYALRSTCPTCIRAPTQDFSPRSLFIRAKKLERAYATRLRSLAHIVDRIIRGFDAKDPTHPAKMAGALEHYASTITPWAEAVADRMIKEVAQRDERSWFRIAERMGKLLRKEIETAPTGAVMRKRLDEQVVLIKSLPLDAAKRVQKLAQEARIEGTRADVLAKKILETGNVTKARANMIARTEVSKTATELTAARALKVGSTHFIWRTAEDSDVRKSHKALNGKTFRWDTPPECDPGYHALPGGIFNCFPGDTRVSLGNGVKTVWRVPYEGEIVNLNTCDGLISATPNHPILTQRGWIAIGEVQHTDYLIKALDDAAFVGNPNDDNAIVSFEDLFGAVQTVGEVRIKAGLNFYGDIPKGDVEEVSFNGNLTLGIVTQRSQSLKNFILSVTHSAIRFSGRGLREILKSFGPCRGQQCSSFVSVAATHPHVHSLAAATNGHTVLDEPYAYGPAIDRKSFGNGSFTEAVQIESDDFRVRKALSAISWHGAGRHHDTQSTESFAQSLRGHAAREGGIFQRGSRRYQFLRVNDSQRTNFCGHVYTMETYSGWYSLASTGAISKNCRCYPEPVLPE